MTLRDLAASLREEHKTLFAGNVPTGETDALVESVIRRFELEDEFHLPERIDGLAAEWLSEAGAGRWQGGAARRLREIRGRDPAPVSVPLADELRKFRIRPRGSDHEILRLDTALRIVERDPIAAHGRQIVEAARRAVADVRAMAAALNEEPHDDSERRIGRDEWNRALGPLERALALVPREATG